VLKVLGRASRPSFSTARLAQRSVHRAAAYR
jgi:hypothetical protein